MVVLRDDSSPGIPEFFAGRAVFITGATGFMGKVLIERLLATCPDIGRLHLLVRDKAGAKPEDRLLALKRSQAFDVLRKRNPSQLDKLRLVCGDITRPGLGIAADALADLQEVSVVFNVAATVRFDEPLRGAAELNVLSVARLLELADGLPRVQAFVQVSTAYSNVEQSTIQERLYPLPSDLPSMLASALALPDHTPKEQVQRIISPKPNTYTYTKAMGEALVAERRRAYPIAIFRPSIVTGSLRDPFPGWIENFNGPSGVIVPICSGLLHTFACEKTYRADLLPVDIAIDTLIAVAWETAIDKSDTVKVYNCSTSAHPTTWAALSEAVADTARAQPLSSAVWYPYCVFTNNRFVYETVRLLAQTIPFHVIEYTSRLFSNRKSRLNLIKFNTRMSNINEVLRFFVTNEWTFCTDNVRRLRTRLSRADAAVFNLDTGTIEWKKYLKQFVRGCCLYLAKDKEENLPQARKRLQRFRLYHLALTALVPLLLASQLLSPQRLAAAAQAAAVTVAEGAGHLFGLVRTWIHV